MSSARISRSDQPIWDKARQIEADLNTKDKSTQELLASILVTIASIQSDIQDLDSRITALESP